MEKPTQFSDDTLEEFMEYLDALRESGATNMFGASPYLQDEFGLERRDAREVLSYWMHTFEERHSDKG